MNTFHNHTLKCLYETIVYLHQILSEVQKTISWLNTDTWEICKYQENIILTNCRDVDKIKTLK